MNASAGRGVCLNRRMTRSPFALGVASFVAALALFSTASSSIAADPIGAFRRLDLNRSGAVSWDEWRTVDPTRQARQDFEAVDANRDEQISADEWTESLGRSGAVLHVLTRLDAQLDEPSGEGGAVSGSRTALSPSPSETSGPQNGRAPRPVGPRRAKCGACSVRPLTAPPGS